MNRITCVICFAIISTVTANAGYNYPQGRPPVQQNLRPGGYSFQQQQPLSSPPLNVQSPPLPNKQNFLAPQYSPPPPPPPQFQQAQPSFNAPSQQYGAPPNAQPQYNNQNQHGGQSQRETIISKDIYIHSAPEETEEISPDGGPDAPIRKNYRIVFIKAPSQNIKFKLPKPSEATNEEKTIIYVLSKKPDITNIQSQATVAEQKAHKPEVYFIKYKTQEEAARAQQEIQAQYDALGGSTNISDEGLAPVTSVIGNGGGGPSGGISGGISSNTNFQQSSSNNQASFAHPHQGGSNGYNIQPPSNRYLPAKKK